MLFNSRKFLQLIVNVVDDYLNAVTVTEIEWEVKWPLFTECDHFKPSSESACYLLLRPEPKPAVLMGVIWTAIKYTSGCPNVLVRNRYKCKFQANNWMF